MWALIPALLLMALATIVSGSRVVQLTDLNFDIRVNGSHSWLVEVHAPWCAACQQMAPAWEELADRMADHHPDTLIGQVDGTTERGLLRRFGVQHYPSIYHLTPAGAVRTYEGVRTVAAMEAFALEGWRGEEAASQPCGPLSRCGRLVGAFSQVPARVKGAYFRLREESRYSDLALLSGLLSVPVALGLGVICALDLLHSGRGGGRPVEHPAAHQNLN